MAKLGARPKPVEPRFWKWTKKVGPDECWEWTGSKIGGGYGNMCVNGKRTPATKISWSIANGKPFPDGMDACHTCDNPSCVNPKHIWPGTVKDNMQDANRKKRLRQHRVTHCPQGHEYAGDNLAHSKNGEGYPTRTCKACKHTYYIRRRDKARAAREALAQANSIAGGE